MFVLFDKQKYEKKVANSSNVVCHKFIWDQVLLQKIVIIKLQ